MRRGGGDRPKQPVPSVKGPVRSPRTTVPLTKASQNAKTSPAAKSSPKSGRTTPGRALRGQQANGPVNGAAPKAHSKAQEALPAESQHEDAQNGIEDACVKQELPEDSLVSSFALTETLDGATEAKSACCDNVGMPPGMAADGEITFCVSNLEPTAAFEPDNTAELVGPTASIDSKYSKCVQLRSRISVVSNGSFGVPEDSPLAAQKRLLQTSNGSDVCDSFLQHCQPNSEERPCGEEKPADFSPEPSSVQLQEAVVASNNPSSTQALVPESKEAVQKSSASELNACPVKAETCDDDLQRLLMNVYDKICDCTTQLNEDRLAVGNDLGSDGAWDDELDDEAAWQEVESLRQAATTMYQHLLTAQQRQLELERACQEYERQAQTHVVQSVSPAYSASIPSSPTRQRQADGSRVGSRAIEQSALVESFARSNRAVPSTPPNPCGKVVRPGIPASFMSNTIVPDSVSPQPQCLASVSPSCSPRIITPREPMSTPRDPPGRSVPSVMACGGLHQVDVRVAATPQSSSRCQQQQQQQQMQMVGQQHLMEPVSWQGGSPALARGVTYPLPPATVRSRIEANQNHLIAAAGVPQGQVTSSSCNTTLTSPAVVQRWIGHDSISQSCAIQPAVASVQSGAQVRWYAQASAPHQASPRQAVRPASLSPSPVIRMTSAAGRLQT